MSPPQVHGPHEPLSALLARLLSADDAASLTANQLIARTGGRGLYLVLVLLSLPFVAWVSVPGMSTAFGPAIGWLALRAALGKPTRLPRRLGDRPLSPRVRQAILGGGLKFLRFLEKAIRPRRTGWMSWRAAHLANSLLIVGMSLLLALPLPSPPFFGSNALPSYAIILIALSMMEEDGVMIWFGYLAALVALAYFGVLGGLVWVHLARWFEQLLR
ncbi:MAG: exopolysaccharide biosynthesis protein, partial [Verrucomicrobiae bacterium]|nr:exopolysaccharide biosynthesis protein [Verrucomicrobiae bacterium]